MTKIEKEVVHQGILGAAFTYCGLKKTPILVKPYLQYSNNWTEPEVTCPKCLEYRHKSPSFIPPEVAARLTVVRNNR